MKPKLAIVGLTGCTGCVISILDLHEELLDVLNLVDLVYCTTIIDTKVLPEVDIAIIHGTVANYDDVEKVYDTRKKAKKVMTLGSCACFGGITGLRNYFEAKDVIDTAYAKAPSNVDGVTPYEVVPALQKNVQVVKDIVQVDYQMGGCPPVPSLIKNTLVAILTGKEIELPTKNLCGECEKKHESMLVPTKEFLTFQVNSPMTSDYDATKCFLEQGILCLGFSTRMGCGGRCVNHGNLPCRGCMGPLEKGMDQGCATITALASIFPIGQLISKEDLPGTVYRYSLPNSILHRMKSDKDEAETKQ